MIDIRDIRKSFERKRDTVRVLNGVSFRIEAGQFVAIQGASGCGKTTLLLALGALQRPDSGTVLIGDVDPYALAADARAAFRARTIGFVFQQFHLMPYLSVLDNVLTSALAQPVDDATGRARQVLDRLGMSHRLAHVPAELSSGERQRVALARALLHRPKLLLADEPTGNLDSANAAIVLESLAAYAHEGNCVLMVTHSEHAASTSDRELHLNGGVVQR